MSTIFAVSDPTVISDTSATVFEIVSWGAAAVVFTIVGVAAGRQKKVTATLAMSIALGSIFWMEAPYDFATWCQFHPNLPRFPDWGPLGMTAGGLPWLAPVGYVMYNVVPVVGAAALAAQLSAARGWNSLRTLLLTAFVLGFVWDLAFELVGTRLGWWRYARGAEGLTLFPGTVFTFSLTISLFMAVLFTICAWLVGSRNDAGLAPIEAWASRRGGTSGSPGWWHVAGTVIAVQFSFAVLFLPNLLVKKLNLHGAVHEGRLFSDLAPQTGSEPTGAAWLGSVIIVVSTLMVLAVFVAWALRREQASRSASASHSGTP